MDGGSNDGTVEIIREYEEHIHYWVSAPDGGQAQAINKGFELATGDILAWLNSDDSYLPGTLRKVADLISEMGDGIYFGNTINYRNNNVWGSNVVKWDASIDLEYLDYIVQPSSFWTRKVWEKVGTLNEHYDFVFDWEWFIRARNRGIPFYPQQDLFSMYRFHSSHKTSSGGDKRQKEILTLYRHLHGEEFYKHCLLYEKMKHRLKRTERLLSKLKLRRVSPQVCRIMFPNLYKGQFAPQLPYIKRMLGA